MAPVLTLEFDSKDLEIWRSRKVESALARALKMAGGDAIRALRAESKRRIRERKVIKAEFLADKALPLTFPTGTALEALEWRMRVSGKPIPLAKYPARQTRRGVIVQVNKGSPALLGSAFIRTLRSGHRGVFMRQGKARLPIRELFSTRTSDVFADADLVPIVFARAKSVFAVAAERLVPLELSKLAR